ncbi:hypothetical protein [Planctomicrobium piriforme]|uniref:Uncharacterized protein n=1 Tax=Planctomicrobium piriforme TaxID=1576369 RepID=A0A1I3EBT2_9PLAN|nr:hypothetical protein [Planctomicrobium piriforme]SFH96424.1 hypothetical protein SAMN05421753_104156 [Planctomicrobium piriforme]
MPENDDINNLIEQMLGEVSSETVDETLSFPAPETSAPAAETEDAPVEEPADAVDADDAEGTGGGEPEIAAEAEWEQSPEAAIPAPETVSAPEADAVPVEPAAAQEMPSGDADDQWAGPGWNTDIGGLFSGSDSDAVEMTEPDSLSQVTEAAMRQFQSDVAASEAEFVGQMRMRESEGGLRDEIQDQGLTLDGRYSF